MAIPIRDNKQPSVFVDGDEVVILAMRVGDPDLLAIVREADDAEQSFESVLAIGARVMRSAQTTIDAAVVEKRFEMLERRVESGVDKAVEAIAETAANYLDPEKGALKAMLDELDKSLGDAFDPKSKASVLAKFEGLLTGGTANLQKVVRDTVDPGNADSPLGRLKGEIGGDIKELRESVEQLRVQIAGQQGGAEVLDLTAIKGRKFEETVFEAVAGFVSLFGDEPEAVGDYSGVGGNRGGDITVALNHADTAGERAVYVVEVKDSRLSMREALREIDKAMENRAAEAGVLVFANQEQAPTAAPLQMIGSSRVIAVLDKHELDPRALQLALAQARYALQRDLTSIGKKADVERVATLVEHGQRALAVHAKLRFPPFSLNVTGGREPANL